MALRYEVKANWLRNGTWITAKDADKIKNWPREERDRLIKLGMIREIGGEPAKTTTTAATTATKAKETD